MIKSNRSRNALFGTLAVYLLLFIGSGDGMISAQANPEITDRIVATEESSAGSVALRMLVGRLDHPWSIAPLPGGAALITERSGRLLYLTSLDPGGGRVFVVSGVPEVYAVRQGGLLDVIADPDYDDNRRIYLSYSVALDGGSTTRVARAILRESGASPRLEDLQVLFTLNTRSTTSHHYGSRLAIDREGYLYITVGDRGDGASAQDLNTHQGSVVRIGTDGSVPGDNPFGGGSTPGAGANLPELYTWGHRNPQGIAVDPETGRVWVNEHGPRGGDEINLLVPGANYGWPRVTGGVAYSGAVIAESPPPSGMAPPLLEWTPSIAPSGMTFVTAGRYPQWRGDVLVGALAGRHLRRLDLAPRRAGEAPRIIGQERLFSGFARFRDVREGPDGYLYVLTDEDRGGLYRLENSN